MNKRIFSLSWTPKKDALQPPLYRSLARLMEADIQSGTLHPNAKLPPQRELASYLGVNLSTITKAYKLCELRGLINASVGSGTFVSPNAASPVTIVENQSRPIIDLGTIHPFYRHNRLIRDVASDILKRPGSEKLFEYSDPLGSRHHRQAGLDWLGKLGLKADLDSVMIASGAQNALAVILSSLFEPGDRIATDAHTYPNFISLAKSLRIQLVAVWGDSHGMLPAALDEACRTNRLKGAYLMPSGNNPTNAAMTKKRCREIAECVRDNKLLLIEDDNCAALLEKPFPAVANMCPDNSIYISGLSKPVCAGLRVAYLRVPETHVQRLERGFFSHNLKIPSLNMEIATEVILRGLDQEIRREKRELARARNAIFAEVFPKQTKHSATYYQWLPLPDGASGRFLEAKMKEKGIGVFGAERFAVGELASANALRIATCSPNTEKSLRRGLIELRRTLEQELSGPIE